MTTLYIIATLIFVLFFIKIRSLKQDNEMVSGIHYGLMSCFALQGFISMAFATAGISLSLPLLIFIILLTAIGFIFYFVMHYKKLDARIQKSHINKYLLASHTISFAIAMMAGVLIFTVDFIPSSMTGDPARHLMGLLNPDQMNLAVAHKPIYYLLAGIFTSSIHFLEQDQTFIFFNILVLGLNISSCLLLFNNLFHNIKLLAIITCSILICFGYSLFALSYGYYTLLLSSSFLLTAISLLIEYKNSNNTNYYYAITLLITGVVHSHSYLAPDALLMLMGFAYWNTRRRGYPLLTAFWQHAPFWLFIILIAYISNTNIVSSTESFAKVVAARGFVNDSLILNLLPFIPFTALYCYKQRKDSSTQIMLTLIIAATIFSLEMGLLYWMGAAPYYLNRNQIVLQPLLIMTSIAFIDNFKNTYSKISPTLISLLIIIPYLSIQQQPLSTSQLSLKKLLDYEEISYIENHVNARYSPLQMTKNDRKLMTDIGTHQSQCLLDYPISMATLGTDHEVIWFYIYTHIYPSLFKRDDGFVTFKDYLSNYKQWKSDENQKYVVIMKNFDFWNSDWILEDIRSKATLVCQGDSIEIYKKTVF